MTGAYGVVVDLAAIQPLRKMEADFLCDVFGENVAAGDAQRCAIRRVVDYVLVLLDCGVQACGFTLAGRYRRHEKFS